MATLLLLLCESAANAQLIGCSHPEDIVGLLTAISRGDKLITREKTARLLFTARSVCCGPQTMAQSSGNASVLHRQPWTDARCT